ncbi:hypothetical protein FRB99_004521, partial [Tulasnella sp. 403]
MTGPRKTSKKRLQGSFHSHQVPLESAFKDDEQFSLLDKWLQSYRIRELLELDLVKSGEGWFVTSEALSILPKRLDRRPGMLKESYAMYRPLDLPSFEQFAVEGKEASLMKTIAKYLAEVVRKNPSTFRIFSPDEFESNKLDGVFEATMREFEWDPETAKPGGRVIEMLSEHNPASQALQGFLQGYLLTGGTWFAFDLNTSVTRYPGRHGLFPSYEAFIGIVTTMIEQYAKFRKLAGETTWREPVASLNYIVTSTLWRQEHNGYSHQNPGLIGNLLTLPRHMTRIYLPPDGNCALSVIDHCLRSKDYVNL